MVTSSDPASAAVPRGVPPVVNRTVPEGVVPLLSVTVEIRYTTSEDATLVKFEISEMVTPGVVEVVLPLEFQRVNSL